MILHLISLSRTERIMTVRIKVKIKDVTRIYHSVVFLIVHIVPTY